MPFLMKSERYGKGTVRYRYPSEKSVESRGCLNCERLLNVINGGVLKLTQRVGDLTINHVSYLEYNAENVEWSRSKWSKLKFGFKATKDYILAKSEILGKNDKIKSEILGKQQYLRLKK